MKTLLALLFSFSALACNNPVSLGAAQKIINGEQAQAHDCKPDQADCLCYDTVDWEAAEIVDETVDGDPIYTINSQSVCADETDCQAKMAELVCDAGFTAKYRLDNPQVFCERLDGYEQVQTGKKKLVNNSAKAAAKIQREALKEQKRQERKSRKAAAKQELSNIDWSQITTVAKVRQVLKAVVDKLEDEE